MTFDRIFNLSFLALVGTGFCALVATQQLDLPAILIYIVVLAVSWGIDEGRISWHLSRRASLVTIPVMVPVVILEWRLLGSSPALVIMHFVLIASALKLLSRKTTRDWFWLSLVSFGQLIMSAGLLVGPEFLVLLIVYLFLAIQSLALLEVRRSLSRSAPGPASAPSPIEARACRPGAVWRHERPRWSRISLFASLMLVGIMLLAVPSFLMMPRLVRGSSRQGLLATESLSGFSDSVRLGDVAEIKLNPQVVMRVRVDFPVGIAPRPLRWRGVTLDHYDGRNWIESGMRTTALRRTGNSFVLDRRSDLSIVTDQRFMLEPLNVNTVFAAPRPLFLVGLGFLSRDDGDGLRTSPHASNQIGYRVFSDTRLPTPEELRADNSRVYSTEVRRRYLQLPPSSDPRIARLGEELTRGAATQYDAVRRIEEHLRTAYAYSLSLERRDDGEPVADFLFNVRKGHCEYFASSMVLLLRSRRIPARLVNGFQMGEHNASGDFYTVRQSDAHSWVEVFFPNSGWVEFDPTPAAGLSTYDQGWLARLRQYREALEMMWLENVVGFDTRQQIAVASGFRRLMSRYRQESYYRWSDWMADLVQRSEAWREHGLPQWRPSSWLSPDPTSGSSIKPTRYQPVALVIAVLLLTLIAVRWWRIRARRRQAASDPSRHALAFYREMLTILGRRGYRRAPSQTPAEFATAVPLPGVTELTDFYNRVRFGRQPLAEDEIQLVDRYLRELKVKSGE